MSDACIGYELNITYQPLRWLELYGSFSQDRARFTSPFADGTGHVGYYLPNAPFATGWGVARGCATSSTPRRMPWNIGTSIACQGSRLPAQRTCTSIRSNRFRRD
jgi:hypothetical protein